MADWKLQIRVEFHLKTTTLLCLFLSTAIGSKIVPEQSEDPKPKPWPEQFHAILVMNNTKTSELQVVDLWYDWPNGRNLNLIQHQLGKLLYDVEWTNGTSYYFTRKGSGNVEPECKTMLFEVGILRPNWLDGATYVGQEYVDGFLCNVWEKVEFIRYYEDVVTQKPVHWLFYTGIVLTLFQYLGLFFPWFALLCFILPNLLLDFVCLEQFIAVCLIFKTVYIYEKKQLALYT